MNSNRDSEWCGILLLILESFLWWTNQLKGNDIRFQPLPIDKDGFLLVALDPFIFRNLVWKWRKPNKGMIFAQSERPLDNPGVKAPLSKFGQHEATTESGVRTGGWRRVKGGGS